MNNNTDSNIPQYSSKDFLGTYKAESSANDYVTIVLNINNEGVISTANNSLTETFSWRIIDNKLVILYYRFENVYNEYIITSHTPNKEFSLSDGRTFYRMDEEKQIHNKQFTDFLSSAEYNEYYFYEDNTGTFTAYIEGQLDEKESQLFSWILIGKLIIIFFEHNQMYTHVLIDELSKSNVIEDYSLTSNIFSSTKSKENK